jgi:hypothetical protein
LALPRLELADLGQAIDRIEQKRARLVGEISLASELLGLVPVRCLQDRLEVIVVVVQSSGSAFFLLFFVLFSPLP